MKGSDRINKKCGKDTISKIFLIRSTINRVKTTESITAEKQESAITALLNKVPRYEEYVSEMEIYINRCEEAISEFEQFQKCNKINELITEYENSNEYGDK